MLIASHLSKEYETARGPVRILDDVSLEVARGDSVAIMGPSGCGKSTLLYMLGALERPSSGTVTLDDQNPYKLNDADQSAFRNQHVGFVFQDHLLLPQLSALDNVLAPTLVSRDSSAASTRTARARSLLEDRPSAGRTVGRRAPARGDRACSHPAAEHGAV
jgi:lipoprotein-releasing system ATP-binding protein